MQVNQAYNPVLKISMQDLTHIQVLKISRYTWLTHTKATLRLRYRVDRMTKPRKAGSTLFKPDSLFGLLFGRVIWPAF